METSAKSKGSLVTFLGLLLIIGLLLLVFIIDQRRRQVEGELQKVILSQQNVAGGDNQQNVEEANRIVDQVRKVYALPTGIEPTVATIVKVEELRKINSFYNNAQNGDNLIVTTDRAILFRPSINKVIDVIPVQIQQPSSAPAAAASSAGKPASKPAPKQAAATSSL